MSRVPRIRFKGFKEDWEQRKLEEIGNTYSGLSGKTKDDFGHGQASFITYMNVYSNPVSRCDMVEPIEIDNRQNEVEIGDVFFTTSSETPEEVGMTSVLTEKKGIIYLNSFCFGFRPFEKIDKYYLAYMLRSKNTREKIVLLAQGISRYNISKNKAMEIFIELPSLDEQVLIGKNFQLIDHLITLHQRKLEKLKIIKKSMLENLFPQNGEKTPKIRFSGFTKDWEQRKLGEIVDVCNGRDYKHLLEGDIPVYGTGGYMISVNKALSYDRDAIGIGRKGTIDKPYILNAPFWTVDTLFYVIPRDKGALSFVFGIFQNIDWEKKDESTGVPSLSKTAINEIDVFIPKYEEQQVLGLFFNGIDHLITLHQSKLEKLQKIKKSMLESMFV